MIEFPDRPIYDPLPTIVHFESILMPGDFPAQTFSVRYRLFLDTNVPILCFTGKVRSIRHPRLPSINHLLIETIHPIGRERIDSVDYLLLADALQLHRGWDRVQLMENVVGDSSTPHSCLFNLLCTNERIEMGWSKYARTSPNILTYVFDWTGVRMEENYQNDRNRGNLPSV